MNEWEQVYCHETNAIGPSGPGGTAGGNIEGLEFPTGKKNRRPLWEIINNYKVYLINTAPDHEFLKTLNTHSLVTRQYNALGMIHELEVLEKNYQSQQQVDYKPTYVALLDKLELITDSDISNYLYFAVLSKIHVLERQDNGHLIMDTSQYLHLINNRITSLKYMKNDYTRYSSFDNYKKTLSLKIENARKVGDQITSFFDDFQKELVENIEMLLNEVEVLKSNAEAEHDAFYSRMKDKLKRTTALSQLLTVIEPLGKFVSFMFPFTAEYFKVLSSEETDKFDLLIKLVEAFKNEEHIKISKPSLTNVSTELKHFLQDTHENIDVNSVKTLENAMKHLEEKIRQLSQYQSVIGNVMNTLPQKIHEEITQMQESLPVKNHADLIRINWQVKNSFQNVRMELQRLAKDFSLEEDLVQCINKISGTITTIIDIYNQIQMFEDQKNFAEYLLKINSNADNQNQDLRQLDMLIESNIVIGQYESAVKAVMQRVFPFAKLFVDTEFHLPNEFDPLVSVIVKRVQQLEENMVKAKITISNTYDQHIHEGIFDSQQPFYTWNQKNFGKQIRDFLEGKEIFLVADVAKSSKLNAVKFREIRLTYSILDENFKTALERFNVRLTHLGNSYYRCGSKFYMIPGDMQTIEYSNKYDNNGQPVNKNMVYKKLRESDGILSPYTVWGMKLLNGSVSDFKVLADYADQVSLSLEGYGEYLSPDAAICSNDNEELEKYYEVFSSDNELNELIQTVDLDDEYYKISSTNDHIFRKREVQSFATNSASMQIKSPINVAWSFIQNIGFSIFNKIVGPIGTTSFLSPHENYNEAINILPRNYETYNKNEIVIHEISNDHSVRTLPSVSTDLNSNLLLGQLFVNKMFGTTIPGRNWISPEEERIMKVNQLASEILPILKKGSQEYMRKE